MILVAQDTNLVPIYPARIYLPIPPSKVAIPDAISIAVDRKSKIFLSPPSTEPPIATRVCLIALVTALMNPSTALKNLSPLEDDNVEIIPFPSSARRGLRWFIIPTRAFLRLSTALLNAPWLNPLTSLTTYARASMAVLITVAKLLIKLVFVATSSTKEITCTANSLIAPNTPFTS